MKMADVSNRDKRPGQLPHGLRHQARLQADVRVAHLPLDLGPRDEGGDRVDDHDVERRRPHEHVGDLERLLAGVGLRHQQLVDVDPELASVRGIERVLRVDERGDAALRLRLRDHVQTDRGLARALGAEDLDDPAARDAADAERDIEGERAGRDDRDAGPHRVLAELHHRALAELLLDLLERDVEHLLAIHRLVLLVPSRLAGEEDPTTLVSHRGDLTEWL